MVSALLYPWATVPAPAFLTMYAPILADRFNLAALTVADWCPLLSPDAVSQYVFTSYNSLLSHLAMEELTAEDFPACPQPSAGPGPETVTLINLRTALATLYPGSTCTLTTEGQRRTLTITVPGGERDTWPEGITYALVQ